MFASSDFPAATDDAGINRRCYNESRNPLLLLGPRIGQGLGEAGDGEIRRRGAIDDRRNDAGRQEGEGSEQADVPFALGLTLGNLGEGGNARRAGCRRSIPWPW